MLQFGGFDSVVNTAAIYPTPDPATPAEGVWGQALQINVTSNHVLAQEAATVLKAQGLPGGDRADELGERRRAEGRQRAVRRQQGGNQPPDPRAGDRAGSARPRERHRAGDGRRRVGDVPARSRHRLAEEVQHRRSDESESTEELRSKLAEFYAQRTITRRPILPIDCANAICWLAGEQSARTTGHVIPVDGGLPEAFLR